MGLGDLEPDIALLGLGFSFGNTETSIVLLVTPLVHLHG